MLTLFRYIKKRFRFYFYRVLYVLDPGGSRIRIFDEKLLKDKRVIIIGPADTSVSYMSGSEIDGFDYIVRVNKSPLSVTGMEEKVGSRTDILYHCFSEDEIDGGGRIDFDVLHKQNNKYIVYSYAEPVLEHVFYKTVNKYKGKVFHRVRSDFFKTVKQDYPAKWPTTGLQAILHLMTCDFKELHITGFTFFRTGYVKGYTSEEINKSVLSRKKQIERSGSHSYEGELDLFIKYLKFFRGKNIFVDEVIKGLVKESVSKI